MDCETKFLIDLSVWMCNEAYDLKKSLYGLHTISRELFKLRFIIKVHIWLNYSSVI